MAPRFRSVQAALQRRLPDCVVGQGYGWTETTASVCVPDRLRGTTPGSVGPPAPGTQLRVVAAETGRDLRDGGARQAVGPRSAGHAGVPRRHRRHRFHVAPQGWLRTGDLGYVRGGEVYVVDRIKELVKVDG